MDDDDRAPTLLLPRGFTRDGLGFSGWLWTNKIEVIGPAVKRS